MTPTITAFERSPDGGKGLARDTRVCRARWRPRLLQRPLTRTTSLSEVRASRFEAS